MVNMEAKFNIWFVANFNDFACAKRNVTIKMDWLVSAAKDYVMDIADIMN